MHFTSWYSKFLLQISRHYTGIFQEDLLLSNVTNFYLLVSKFGYLLNDPRLLSVDIACSQTSKQASKYPTIKNTEVAAEISLQISEVEEDVKTKLAEELSKIRMVEAQEINSPSKTKGKQQRKCFGAREHVVADEMLPMLAPTEPAGLPSSQKKGNRFFHDLHMNIAPYRVPKDDCVL